MVDGYLARASRRSSADRAASRRPAALARHHARLARGPTACSSTSWHGPARARRRSASLRRSRRGCGAPTRSPTSSRRRGAAGAVDGARPPRAARDRDLHDHGGDARRPARTALRGPARRAGAASTAPARATPCCTRSSAARSARARLVLALERGGARGAAAGHGAGDGRPPAVEPLGRAGPAARALAVAYTPDVKAKGLDIVLRRLGRRRAPRRPPRGVRRRPRAARWPTCAARRRRCRTGVEFRGKTPPAQFRAALRPRARVRGRRALGGLRPGAARGAGRRRAARDRPLGRPVRGARPRARAGARAGRRRGRRRRAGDRAARGVRAARASACAPTASAPRGCCERFRPRRDRSARSPREVVPALLG